MMRFTVIMASALLVVETIVTFMLILPLKSLNRLSTLPSSRLVLNYYLAHAMVAPVLKNSNVRVGLAIIAVILTYLSGSAFAIIF
jgi:hypothetical protein